MIDDVLEEVDASVVTTAQITERVPLTDRSVQERLRQLADEEETLRGGSERFAVALDVILTFEGIQCGKQYELLHLQRIKPFALAIVLTTVSLGTEASSSVTQYSSAQCFPYLCGLRPATTHKTIAVIGLTENGHHDQQRRGTRYITR